MLIKENRRIGGMAFQPGLRPLLSGRENGGKGYKTGWVDIGEEMRPVLSEWENADKGKKTDRWDGFSARIATGLSGRENGDKGYKTGWVDTGEAILTLLSGWENGDKVIKSLDKWNSEGGKRVKTSRKERAGTSRNRNEREQEPRGKKPAKVKNE